MSEFPTHVDSTMLSAFSGCERRFELEFLEGWQGQGTSVDLLAGKAFAKGVEVAKRAFWEEGKGSQEAVALGMEALALEYGDFEPARSSAKTKERMVQALGHYFRELPLEKFEPVSHDGMRMIERTLSWPLRVLHPQTGEPIIYCGTPDSVEHYAGGVWACDEKTTGKGFQAGWGRKWALRGQFTGYVWLCQRNGIEVRGVVVKGMAVLPKNFDSQVTMSARHEFQVEEWLEVTERKVERMVEAWKREEWLPNLGGQCEGNWSPCGFLGVCEGRKETRVRWLEEGFEKRVWDPMKRTREKETVG